MTTTDSELLQQFARRRSETAFAEIVRRYLDLVYSAALRQVRSRQLAEEIAQSVFVDLARHADQLKPDTVLAAWLYHVTRRAAIDVVRVESRRQLREQISVELAAMNSPDTNWKEIEPLLDDAMDTLDEPDRASILLRYFENKSLREVGESLGASDNAAQKRVTRAVEQLREYFSKNGVTIGGAGLATLVSANAVQAAPVGFAAIVSSAAAVGTVMKTTGTIAAAGKTLLMTTTQKILTVTALTAAIGAGVYKWTQNSRLQNEVERMMQQLKPLIEQNEQLRRDLADGQKKFLSAQEDAAQQKRQIAELPKLRGEVTRLRASERQSVEENANTAQAEMKSWLHRVAQLKKRFEDRPGQRIPELQLLKDQDWMDAAHNKIETEQDLRKAVSRLRWIAENAFAQEVSTALKKYVEANHGKLPTDVSELKSFLKPPADETFLQRYEIRSKQDSSIWKNERDWNVTQKSPIDEEYDGRWTITPQGVSGMAPGWLKSAEDGVTDGDILTPVMKAFKEDYGIAQPSDFRLLRPYATTPEQKAILEKTIQRQDDLEKK